MAKRPWQRFCVGTPSTKANWVELDCQPFENISHVAHVPMAVRIVEDRKLRADLIFDTSKLNTERIRVVWLSPNYWADGFRYGNISFMFDWRSLIAGKNYYWVESIAYGIEACRILVTKNVYSSSVLETYDPRAGDGPWLWTSDDKHYWNGKYCLEIMVQDDIPLDAVIKIDFVDHHPQMCSIEPVICRYCGRRSYEGGVEFLATLCSRLPSFNIPCLIEDKGKGPVPTTGIEVAASRLFIACKRLKPQKWGTVKATDGAAGSLARALLGTWTNDALKNDRVEIASFFKSPDDMVEAVAEVLAKAIGLPNAGSFL